MSEKPAELFADRIGEIRFINGVFRIDLISFGQNANQATISQRVVMTPDGFMQSLGTMQEMMRKLVDAGLVQSKDAGEQPAGPAVSSPNFPGLPS